MSWLAGLAGVGSALSGVASILGLTKKNKQQSPVLNWKDFNRSQQQLDISAPKDLARQQAFLEGIAPAEGMAYNTIQDLTWDADTQRQKDRMDQLYPGTSPGIVTGKRLLSSQILWG